MPRKRQYANEAERQAAHRQRQAAKNDDLMGRLYVLERTVWEAADAGDPIANKVKAASLEALLEALIRHFQEQATGGAPGE